jgi:hypothetical protein
MCERACSNKRSPPDEPVTTSPNWEVPGFGILHGAVDIAGHHKNSTIPVVIHDL